MSMPIQRQSDQYGAFESGPRWERERTSHDLPQGLAGLVNSMGPRISSGLLNTRLAVNVDGMDPDSHAYHTEHRVDGPGPGRIWNPDFREYEPSEQDERDQEGVAEDDESGYNWGPEPRRASRHPFDRTAACQECGEEIEPENSWEWTHSGDDYYEHTAEPSPEDEAGRAAWEEERGIGGRGRDTVATRLAKDGDCTCWEGYERVPGTEPCASGSCRKKSARTAAGEVAVDPSQMQMPQGGGYQIAHRVGLPWRGKVIPGTVINLDGPNVAVRWDDGQYSTEEPHNIQLL